MRLDLKKPFSDGTVAIDLDPLSLLWRLCAAVPPPRRHTVVYSGVLSSHAKWRSRILLAPPAPTAAAAATAAAPARGPPYWRSKVLVRRSADAHAERSDEQRDLFHT